MTTPLKIRMFRMWVQVTMIGCLLLGPVLHAQEPGLVAQKPAEGPAIQTARGFMVPYSFQITGTKVTVEMVPIPGGKFLMGSPAGEKDRASAEGPTFEVTIEPFWMGKYEVTWDQYDVFYNNYTPLKDNPPGPIPADREADAISFPTLLWGEAGIPIINAMGREGGYPAASMHQFCAKQFTKWMSKMTGQIYRLPTGAEWEYACRAGTTTAYYFGDDPKDLEDHAWFFDNSAWDEEGRGHPDNGGAGYRQVGKKKPNPWGLYDMYGNVAEWVLDQYVEDHYGKFAGKSLLAKDAVAWPTTMYPRELRGGHWLSDPKECRSASRLGSIKLWADLDPQIPKSAWHMTQFWAGFRLIRPLDPPSPAELVRCWEPDDEETKYSLKDLKQVRALVEQLPKPAVP